MAFPDHPHLLGKQRACEQSFFIGMTQDQTGSGELLIECQVIDDVVYARAVNYSRPSDKAWSMYFDRQYEYIVREICSTGGAEKPLMNLKAISIQDLDQIWSWNAQVPQSVDDVCIHEAFMERAQRHPDNMAISAHDGELTYGKLDELSTQLANLLIQEGIQHSSTIIVFLEKSMWVPVAQLAIMKCGCASTVLDASLPFQRQQAIAELVQASAVLTSTACEERTVALGLGCAHFVLDNYSSQNWPRAQPDCLPTVSPSSWMYIVFTSGSTGTPKGAIISHANYASAVAAQQKGLDFREFDRIFDFASYAFDASWCNLIHALMVGGCLCIPSDEERKGDLVAALHKYEVNYAVLTPSAAWFPASELPATLRTIHFGGEPLQSTLVKELSVSSTVINAYGPAECSTVSTATVTNPNDDKNPTIGTGLGACTWIVKLDGTDLVPVGEIGELWIEGPIVGQGYLRDPEKTATTFVDNPPWLLRGCPSLHGMKGHTGRKGRLYRSGDVVRYRADGTLEFVGRKDSQVKIRGQRVELGEIEYNLQRALTESTRAEHVQIVAEVIKPDGSKVPTLVAFLFMAVSSRALVADAKPILHRALEGFEDRLAQFVPPYMIPSAFFPVEDVPMTPTGKLDRRCLRENSRRWYWQQPNGYSMPKQVEVGSELEEKLRCVWTEVLNFPLKKIGIDSAFTRLGGDSITAMQVVSRCRSQNISIKVVDILKLQTIRLIAQSSKPVREKVDWLRIQANECHAWPLTPIQRIFFENNPQGINHYTLSYIVKLVRPTNLQELLSALLAITARHGMLRARFRRGKDGSTWEQYLAPVGTSSFLLKHHDFEGQSTMQQVINERQASMDLINGPTFAVDVFGSHNEAQTLLMSAHHVMMDLVSWRIIWHDLSQYLSGTTHLSPVEVSFQAWCHLQREEAGRLNPAAVLPFEITPANFQYWGVKPGEVCFGDSMLNLSTIDAEETALLLGTSNDGFRTEILDILIGSLIFSFCRTFPDRNPPPVFVEGHGRESVSGMDDIDLSEVIGWFTSIHPVELGGGPSDSILDMIKFAKDVRRRVPGKGRPYFATRFYSAAGRKAFEEHKHVELILNYRGSFQQLEDANSMFQLEDRKDRNLLIRGEADEYQRPSLIDLNLVIQEGKLQIWTRSHKHMRNHEAVIRWVDLYAKTLSTVAHELAGLPTRYTLADFPLLNISYTGLETLVVKQLAGEGIVETEVRDIYPCTPMQEGILISTNIGVASYNSVSIWQAVLACATISVSRLKTAWGIVSRMHPVFSTVFLTNPDTGRFVQVLFNTNITVRESRGGPGAVDGSMELVEVLEEDPHEYDLVLSAILKEGETDIKVQYRTDFVTLANVQEIQAALQSAIGFLSYVMQHDATTVNPYTEHSKSLYDDYFHHIVGTEETVALERWKVQFQGIDSDCHFPVLPYEYRMPNINASISCAIENLQWRMDCDEITQILASWALLQASYGGSADVVIGACLFGAEYRATNYAIPTPLRINADPSQSVLSYLDSVHSTIETWSKLPQLSIHRLRRLSEVSALACGFQTMLSVGRASDQGKGEGPNVDSNAAWALSVHVKLSSDGVHLAASFDKNVIGVKQVDKLFSQLETVLRQVCSPINSSSALTQIDTISDQDLQEISSWNGTPYEDVQDLVHNLISRVVHRMPDSLAVSSWDGELTYRQLDQVSTRLAYRLVELGVGPELIVPLYFEKSMWVPVSAVAIMKAGGAGVMIDCTQPIERASSIFSQVNAKIILTSRTNVKRASQFEGLQLLVIDEASISALPEPGEGLFLPQQVQPSNLVYVSFTSGSTGSPKGAMITHSCFSSSIKHQQMALGFRVGQRVYDFASYAFDASWSNLLHSLTSGGCLCIPSEDQRRNALADSIRDSKATLLNATPSVLRHIDPKQLPDLKQVLMGGEAWVEADFVDWIDNTNLINSYGPGECTIKSCLIRAFRGMIPNTVGVGIGLNTWIVRTDGSERLSPLGAVGELWLEGPQVGRGYIADESRTAASFLTRPKWTEGGEKTCRFYRTGDLVRYGPDGVIVFVSRIDSQVKIRGQRTELAEVESSIQKALSAGHVRAQVIADVFKPYESDNPILVAFLKSGEADAWHKLDGLDEQLAKMVPEYMIPTVYIPLQSFPMTATGKIHRRSLRETFAKKTLEQIIALDAFRVSSRRAPSTASEKIMQTLWAQILQIAPTTISADDSFLRIGGDSLGAMRLVSTARKQGLAISVADIFKQPKLSALAKMIEGQIPTLEPEEYAVEPFSLLVRKTSQEARIQASSLCGLETTDIEDVFPCTPLQAGLLAETFRRPGDNVLTEAWMFRKDVDIGRFRAAWQNVIRANPILRTRIVDLGEEGLVQAVVRPLVCYKISESGFSWSIHHALYDGWSMPLILDSLAKSYQWGTVQSAPPFQAFIKYLQNCNKVHEENFWKAQFCDFDAQIFPSLPDKTYKPRCDRRLKLDINDISSDGDFTVATRIRLAWAILLSTVTNGTDASFGATVSGRHANVPGIEGITGPTFATVPLRVAIDRSKTVKQLLQQVQLQAADMMPFEQTGMQHIRRLNECCNLGCQFQSHMVIQPGRKNDDEDVLFESSFVHTEAGNVDPFKVYAICLEFVLNPNNVCLQANYDSNVVPQTRFSRLADRFENILRQISSPETQDMALSLLNHSSLSDMRQIWTWNETPLHRSNRTVHEIFAEVAATQPEAPAVCSWDGNFTYAQVDEISTRVAHELLRSGLPQSGQRIVPLLFEKSKWTSVCQIAVMKANGTSVALDATVPAGRLQMVMTLAKPQIILTSVEQEFRARELVPSTTLVIVVGEAQMHSFRPPADLCLPAVDPDTWLYVVFTSGSTGTPKGAIISHSNFTSALNYGQMQLQFGPHTRAYDFVSYAFDVSWLNVLYTFCAGGCLCVPSQHEIQNEPKEAIARRYANTAFITPTVGKLLHGAELKVINYGGENLPRDEIDYWRDRAHIIHSYGPSECTPISISHNLDPARSRVIIGKGLGAQTWIVEPEDGQSLVAVGDVGELWLEGPLLGQGYLDDPETTRASFVNDPEWLIRGCPGFAGRQGRLYRTGDLVRYEEDGNLEFIGRKDAQRKIRGQRVELGEIEHHIFNIIGEATASQVVVDIVKPAGLTESVLVAFIKLADEGSSSGTPEPRAYTQELATFTRDRLSATLPSYMIPNGYVIVDSIPNTTSGKVDRGKLCKSASQMRKEDLLRVDRIARRAPETPQEMKLHAIVAQILLLDNDSFGMDNNFIQLGGDSISAMRLASIARESAISLAVADILTKEMISDLLLSHHQADLRANSEELQFDILDGTDWSPLVEEEVMRQLQSGHGKLIDIVPATDMQSHYLRDNIHTPRRSWFYSYIDFDQIHDEHRLIHSCLKLVEHCDIYRTAFFRSGDLFFQAVFDSWEPTIDITEDVNCIDTVFHQLVEQDVKSPASLGVPLAHFQLIRGLNAKAKLVFSMSHAVYDAISFGQTLEILTNIYKGSTPETMDFRFYARHVQSHKAMGYSYWRKMLGNSFITTIPSDQVPPLQDKPPTVLVRSVPMPKTPSGITHASLFTLACASALSRLTGSSDVVFGRVVSGRVTGPASLHKVVGPCLNRLPVRVRFSSSHNKAERLAALQKQYAESLAYETTGLSDIVKHCTDWPQSTRDFGCWTQYQNVEENPMLDIPGAIAGLGSKDMWDIPVHVNFLEIFGIPSYDGTLVVRLIAGSAYTTKVQAALLGGVCSELLDAF
ncbi:hypothetical protein G7Z17_g620 [Cylindrodendrum hubeiense]|uniref:Carrier domain-containing protein n=1 Tax=Cylindrodendrum hubeiense TaxID=595255 RepID=A0A9P5HGK9_9HYPO|nr:hypothetical protein G7Z17_g620 [Cylindrodendrum hubeiense]